MTSLGTLVLGVGNVLLGDEGVGVRAAEALAAEGVPRDVTVVDGGTGGFHLLDLLRAHDPVVLVDATLDGRPAGTVEVRVPRHASDFPRCLSAHDIGLRDLVESASLLGPLPRLVLVTISVEEIQPMELALSPEVEAAIPEALRAVREALAGRRVESSSPSAAT